MEPDLPPDSQPQQALPIPDGASPVQVFAAHKQMGMPDLDAALATRDYLRRQADARGSFRNAQDLIVGLGKTPLTGDALQKQLYEQADQPLADAQMKAGVRYGQALADPNHPANQVVRQLAAQRLGVKVPDNFTVYDMEQVGGPGKMLADYAKTVAEGANAQAQAGATTIKAVPEARKLEAEAGKTGAEAAQVAPNAQAERGLKVAEAGKTAAEAGQVAPSAQAEQALKGAQAGQQAAEAGKIRMETTGQVVPGYTVQGGQGVTQKDREDLKDKFTSVQKSDSIIDDLQGLLNGSDYVANPRKVAQAKVLTDQLVLASKEAAGIRGLPEKDVKFLQDMQGTLTLNLTSPLDALKKIVGLAQTPTKLAEFKHVLHRGFDIEAGARGW